MSTADRSTPRLGGAMAWWVWALAVTFVVYLFSVQTGYAIVNANVQKDVGLSVTQVATITAAYTWVFALEDLDSVSDDAAFLRRALAQVTEEMGWLMGLEPTTTGITIRDSTN